MTQPETKTVAMCSTWRIKVWLWNLFGRCPACDEKARGWQGKKLQGLCGGCWYESRQGDVWYGP